MLRVCVKCVVNTVFCGNDVHSLQSLQTLIAILEQSILKMLSVNSKTSDNLSCQMIYPNYITVFKKFFGNQWPNRRQPTVYFSLRGLFIMAEKYHASFRFFST